MSSPSVSSTVSKAARIAVSSGRVLLQNLQAGTANSRDWPDDRMRTSSPPSLTPPSAKPSLQLIRQGDRLILASLARLIRKGGQKLFRLPFVAGYPRPLAGLKGRPGECVP